MESFFWEANDTQVTSQERALESEILAAAKETLLQNGFFRVCFRKIHAYLT